MKVAVIANSSWYLFNFRRNLMLALRSAGHAVVAIAPPDAYTARLRAEGFEIRTFALRAAGTHPLQELASVRGLRRVLKQQGVDAVLSYTPKGNLYSALATLGMKVRLLPNVSGLGRGFVRDTVLTRLLRRMYRLAFRRSQRVLFQNEDDRRAFVEAGLVEISRTERVPGSGVDLDWFTPQPLPGAGSDAAVTFLMIARLLWDKGVGEYVDAARRVRESHPRTRFMLLGFVDEGHVSGVPRAVIEGWVAEGIVEYLGTSDDIRPIVARADCVVLPSYYREGVPRTLLEAAAMARPLLTTDAIGCRDTVEDGVTGYLCRPRDPAGLGECMTAMVEQGYEARLAMGRSGRAKMEREFDERQVIDRYLALLATNV